MNRPDRPKRRLPLILWGFPLLCLFFSVGIAARAQAGVRLQLSTPDLSQFPTVQFTILSKNSFGAPLNAADFDNLRLRENGVPISEFDLRFVPVGIDAIFVIDADAPLAIVTESTGETRLETVKLSIERYATRFMSPTGLDRVTVIVPGGGNRSGSYLVREEGNPGALIGAVQGYEPVLPEEVPIQSMLETAVAHAADIRQPGRYQAIFLYSEARRLAQFVDFPAITAAANEIDLPIYVAIVGAGASIDEINNALALSEPTNAFYTPLPIAEESDELFLLWQRQGNQPLVTYESLLRESGEYALNINVGDFSGGGTLDLTLAAPEVTIGLASNVLRRAGTAVDTPLADLQPTQIEIPVQLDWADGLPRALESVDFRANGQPQPLLNVPQPDENGVITLPWNVSQLDTGPVTLEVTVTDNLGYSGSAAPFILTVATARPPAPTPTPAPTATPSPIVEVGEQVLQTDRDRLLQVLAGLGLAGILLFLFRWWGMYRRRKAARAAREAQRAKMQRALEAEQAADEAAQTAQIGRLAPLGEGEWPGFPLILLRETVTLGRDGEMATAVLADRSVARLHARVKWGDGRYWLTDEGSDTGTLLNHERLGLSPRLLADGDEIRLGRVRLQFTLHETEEEARAIAAEETTPMPPEEAEAAAENETETKETEEVDGDHDSDL